MNISDFDKIVTRVTAKTNTDLETFCTIMNGINSYVNHFVKDACIAMMSFCQRYVASKETLLEPIDLAELAKQTLVKKAEEYSMAGDRLWNFRPDYSFTKQTNPKELCSGYLMKHAVSCGDIISGKTEPTTHLLKEKFGDLYNYCILLLAIIKEEEKD